MAQTLVAAAEAAKLAVVRVYRDNAVDIVRAAGERLAERCFPPLRGRSAVAGPEPADSEDAG